MRYCWTRRDESLLAMTILPIIKAVTAGSAARVLRVLRHRVLRRLVAYFGHARSYYLIAFILFLAESQRRLRNYIWRPSLGIAKLRLAFENC